MSLNKPTRCKNCNKENVIWWEEAWRPGIKRPRPYDINKYHQYPGQPDKWWHECKPADAQEMDKPNTDYKTKPLLHPCVFPPCEFELIYNPQKGYHCEGSMEGDRHWCLHMPKNYEFDPENPGQKRLKPDLWQKAQEYNRKLQELRSNKKDNNTQQTLNNKTMDTFVPNTVYESGANNATIDASKNTIKDYVPNKDLSEIKQSLKEIALILQGIAAQIKNMTDNQEVGNKYLRVSKDTLLEWKEEMKDMARNPKLTFESAFDDEDDDVTDEIADQDDTTETEEGDLGGFKPSK